MLERLQLFSRDASLDFLEVRWVLSSSDLRIRIIDAQFDGQGRISYAEFDVDCFCRMRYVYDPGYDKLPADIPDELWHEALDNNWYLVGEDWN
jgi:hypothetical protein